MIVSPNRSPFGPFLALILWAAAAPGQGLAQESSPDTGPLRLIPPLLLKPVTPPTPLSGEPAPEETAPSASWPAGVTPVAIPSSDTAPAAKGGVQVDPLRTIDPDAVGVLSESQGGFGDAMWEGTSRNLVETLLPRLPVNTGSTAMRDLMRRLLLSAAAAPRGEAPGGGLVVLRAELLAAMGDLVGVNRLLSVTPGREDIESLARVEADARLLANDNARACALASGQITVLPSAYWQKVYIFCQSLAGQYAKSALGVALLREMGEDDAVFFQLIEALAAGGGAVIDSLPDPTPLHLAMARVVKVKLPADVLSSDNPGVLRTIAISPYAPVGLRLEAAERAEAAGALPVDILRQLYTGVSFSDQDLANPLSRAEAESGPLSRALLYRTALVQTVPTAQAEAVARALSLAREGGRYASTVRVFLPILNRIPPTAELMWFAPEAVRALLIGGELEIAALWFDQLKASARFDVESATALVALKPVVRLAGGGEGNGDGAAELAAWWEDAKLRDGAPERAAMLYSLGETLGWPIAPESWEALLGGPGRKTVAMPTPALWRRLALASGDGGEGGGRRAETVLLSLLALGEGGPGEADPVVLKRVLTSLGRVGMEVEARALAMEAAMAAGL